MNVFSKVTLQTLKRNRTRTLVTIIGIILSTAMITAVATLIVSLQSYMLESTKATTGDWHALAHDMSAADVSVLQQNSEVSSLASMQNIGYARLKDSKNKDMPYLFVAGFSDALYETLPLHVLAGRLPQTDTELLLPQHLAYNGGVECRIGDTLTLNLGKRVSEGYELSQCHAYLDGESEKLVINQARTYTVVGICERPRFEGRMAPGYTAITKADTATSVTDNYDCYVRLHKPTEVYDFIKRHLADYGTETNSSLLMFLGISALENYLSVLYSLAAILIALIMFGSISLIYNAFAISVSERSKQFGLLASIGATKAQLRKSIYYEAFFVSLIGIPLGILSGLFGIDATLHYIGNMFDTVTMNAGVPLVLVVSLPAIGIAAVLALLTVLISAAIPARRANKLTPIEAIRQTRDIAVRPKQVRTSWLTGKLFGLPGILARKNFKRQKGRHKSTIVSLALSIVLFISATAFTDYLKAGTGVVFDKPSSDIYYASDQQATRADLDNIYAQLSAVPEVSKSVRYTTLMATTTIPEALFNKKLDARFIEQHGEAMLGGDYQTVNINCFLPDEAFKEFAQQAGVDPIAYFEPGTPKAIAYDSLTWRDYSEEKYVVNSLFSKHQSTKLALELHPDADLIAVQIDAFTEQNPFGADTIFGNYLILIMPEYHWKAFAEHAALATTHMNFKAKDHAAAYATMQSLLVTESYDTASLTDLSAASAHDRNTLTIINVFCYGFIVLISLIAVANVFNTVFTNIQLRRREFAMLKSVGMAPRGFNKMMHYECGLYALQAVIYGLPIAYGVTYLIYRSIIEGVVLSFTLPLRSTLIAMGGVFLIVFATNASVMRRVRQENIVDALQNENL